MLRKLLMPACALSLCAGSAVAADNGFYLGAAVSQSQIDAFSSNFDLKDTGYKVIAGFRPLDAFAVELNYMDLGSDSATAGAIGFNAEATAIAGFGMLMLPLPFVDLYVKAGVARWDAEASISSITTGGRSTPSIRGMEKPHTSASTTATFLPRAASATARLVVTELLPTPPLPEAINRQRVFEAGSANGIERPSA